MSAEPDPLISVDTMESLVERAWESRRSDPARTRELLERIAEQSSDAATSARCSLIRAAAAAEEENWNVVVARAEEAATVLEKVGDYLWLGRALRMIGNTRDRLGDRDGAIADLLRSLPPTTEAGDRPGLAYGYRRLGDVHLQGGNRTPALEYYRRAMEIFEELDDRSELVDVLRWMGTILHHLSHYDESLAAQHRSMELARELGDRMRVAYALNNAARVHDSRGEYPEALENYRACQAIVEESGDRSSIAIIHTNIGVIHISLGNYAAALEEFQQSLAIAREIGEEERIASALDSIGQVHFSLRDDATAISYFTEAIRIREEIGDEERLAISLGNLANSHLRLGDHAKAYDLHHRVLQIWERAGNQGMIASALSNIGNTLLLQKDPSAAQEFILRGLRIREEIGDRAGMVVDIGNLGEAEHALGNHEQALEHLTAALALALEINALPLALIRHEELARVHERMGDFEKALHHLKEHQRIKEEITSEETRMRLRTLESQRQIDMAQKEAEIERLRAGELADALRQLKQTQAQLVHAGKMAGLGELTAGVAHEINNPINFILSALPPLSRDIQELVDLVGTMTRNGSTADADAELRRLEEMIEEREIEAVIDEIPTLLAAIRNGAERTAEIVRGLRTFSRLDEDEVKPVDLHEGIDATLALLQSRLGERIAVRRLYGTLPAVECYPGQLNQVFLHILSNAIDAIEGQGEIAIETSVGATTATIAISDSGEGIPPENLERIFEPFFTTRDVGRGKGLGLAISYGIIRKHDGRLDVYSTPGEGSRFVITIPI